MYRCVACYEGANVKKPIILLGSGKGTTADPAAVEEMKSVFPEDHVAYGYIRMVYIWKVTHVAYINMNLHL